MIRYIKIKYKNLKQLIKKNRYVFILLITTLSIWYYCCLPRQLFTDSTCTVIYDRKGNVLNARIADDGQWRFPHNSKVPEKFKKCIIQFEDRNFYNHWGISIRGMARAIKQNISAGRVISGGSTITMQVIRLMRKGKRRSFYEKIIESILATRIEWRYTKEEILAHYASNAPMGGNVVGLDAAAWRYFGTTPDALSWAESALLAVLPNAPGLIYPGKNQKKLLNKRNRLLKRLYEIGELDSMSYYLALTEPLPVKPPDLPQLATHLTDKLISEKHKGERIITTLNKNLQEQVTKILQIHHAQFVKNEIYNAACLVLDINNNEVLAYVGNVKNYESEHGSEVDIITAPRSTGSILKPILYAAMLNDGLITPKQLIPDIPTHISGYTPKNYSNTYDGAVPASKALARSLNVPAVRMLQEYGIARFHYVLKKIGISTLHKPSAHYGLSLILGGAEATLWDLSSVYSRMARSLNQYPYYTTALNEEPKYILNDTLKIKKDNLLIFNPAAIWFTFKAMVEVSRPDEEVNWQYLNAGNKIAWKTGTSFGHRDAWSIGFNADYLVAVWVGNADGEGRPGLMGVKVAAPILFDVFSRLPKGKWFNMPYDEMRKVAVCRLSGQKASDICNTVDTVYLPITCENTSVCNYHQQIHLDKTKKWRVHSRCENPQNMQHETYFILPPVMEFYYKFKNPNYKAIPPYRSDCEQIDDNSMEIIYPKKPSKIYIPVNIDGTMSKIVFEVTHRNPKITLYWHLDDYFIGETKDIHQMEFQPGVGKHTLTIVDENGHSISQTFEVLQK